MIVTKRIKIFTLLVGSVLVLLSVTACGSRGRNTETVTLNKTECTMSVGDTLTLRETPEVEPSKLNWESSNERVATVENGKVEAKSKGNATITLSYNGSTVECEVRVEDVEIESIVLDQDSAVIKVGKTKKLSASVYPENASANGLMWSSSDESVAIVNSNGIVTAQEPGTANINCKSKNGVIASCTVTVRESGRSDNNAEDTESNKTTIVYYTPGEIADKYPEDFVFPYSSESYLSDSDIMDLDQDQIQQAINEIYARNGHIFDKGRWKTFFSKYSWYYPRQKVKDNQFNTYEKKNIKLLASYRN